MHLHKYQPVDDFSNLSILCDTCAVGGSSTEGGFFLWLEAFLSTLTPPDTFFKKLGTTPSLWEGPGEEAHYSDMAHDT